MIFVPRIRRVTIAFAAATAVFLSPCVQAQAARPDLQPQIEAYLDPLLKTNNFS